MRRLIINADDFGLTAGVNRAIAEAHESGVVTSATMMANSQAFADAVERALRLPRLSVGCHVVLLDGTPVMPPEKVASLLARNNAGAADGGSLESSLARFALRAWRGRLRRDEIFQETMAQIRKLQSAGIRVSHLDSHKHAHVFPAVLEPMLAAGRECGVRAVRNPFAPLKPLAFAHLARRPRLWRRYSQVRALRRWEENFRRQAESAGMTTTDGTFGIVSTGRLDARLFAAIVGSIPDGTWEFVCHPGYDDLDLAKIRTRLRAARAAELEVLTSKAARDLLAEKQISLISYRDLLR
jgi:chitin disaccharide deacetylase